MAIDGQGVIVMLPLGPEIVEIETQIKHWINSKRVGKDTKLVTAYHIISPPFDVICRRTESGVEVTIAGKDDSVTVECNRVLQSGFRPNVFSFLTFDAENVLIRQRHLARFPPHSQRLLDMFPPDSKFGSDELYAKFSWESDPNKPQAHARRRWKDLKYVFGFNVGFSRRTNMYSRGHTPVPIHDPFPRPEDGKLRKEFLSQLIEKDKLGNVKPPSCNYCGCQLIFNENSTELDDDMALEDESTIAFDESRTGVIETVQDFYGGNASNTALEGDIPRRGLLDHRRPVFQGGNDTVENLQLFCEVCNNLKNSVCRKCPYGHRCDTCLWSHPETVRDCRLVLILEPHIVEGLRKQFGNRIEEKVETVLNDLLNVR